MSDDWKGETLIRAPKASKAELMRVVTLRNYAAKGMTMEAAARRINIGMSHAERLVTKYKIPFRRAR